MAHHHSISMDAAAVLQEAVVMVAGEDTNLLHFNITNNHNMDHLKDITDHQSISRTMDHI
jgi:hypothetical protein